MKIVKTIAVVIVVLVLLILVGGFIFLKTLDVNKYVPLLTQQVKQAVGRDLKVGNASLQVSLWHGISLAVSGVSLSDDRRFSDQAFVSVDKILLGLSLQPLILERKIQIADVTVVAPKVVVIRNKEGLINAAMMGPQASETAGSPKEGAKKEGGTEKMATLPALLIDRVKISDASVTYQDEMFDPRIALTVDHLDFSIKGFSFTEPFSFDLKANMFSQESDLQLSGKARLALNTTSVLLTDTILDIDLAKISTAKLNAMLPMAKPAGLKDPLKGKFTVSVPQLEAGANGLRSLKVSGTLAGGQVISSLVPLPLTDISLTFDGDAKDLVLKSCVFHLAEGTTNVTGTVRGYMLSPAVEMTGKVNEVALGKIIEAYNIPIKVNGKANADIKLSLSGKSPQEMTSSLKAEIAGSLKEGTLEGLNLVQTGLGNIPMLPTLWEMVQPSLPPETQEDIKKGKTVIEGADVLIHMNGMTATVDTADINTRDVVVSANGTAQIPDSVNLGINIYFQKNIASALVQKVPDLAGIRDDKERLYIPFKLNGPLLKPKAEPDVEYLSKKLIMNRGKEALQKVIEKNPQVKGVLNAIFGESNSNSNAPQDGTPQSGGPESNASGQGTPSSTSQAVDTIFNSLFKKK